MRARTQPRPAMKKTAPKMLTVDRGLKLRWKIWGIAATSNRCRPESQGQWERGKGNVHPYGPGGPGARKKCPDSEAKIEPPRCAEGTGRKCPWGEKQPGPAPAPL